MRMHSNVITLRSKNESGHQIVPRVTPNVCDSGHNFGDFRFNSVASEEIPFYTNSVVVVLKRCTGNPQTAEAATRCPIIPRNEKA